MAQAIPAIGGAPTLRVVTNDQMVQSEQADAEARAAAEKTATPDYSTLAGFIRDQFKLMRDHRNNAQSGWAHRLMESLRAFSGQYSPEQLAEIRRFGGSTVYARLTAIKARGASSLLRDVYLGADRSWGLVPNPDPEIPPEIHNAIQQLVQTEVANAQMMGQPIQPEHIRDRINQLMEGARQAAKKKAAERARIAEDKLDEILIEGNFYKALADFLFDISMFPYAVLKGPVVRIVPEVQWTQGTANTISKPRLFWQRVSPFDVYWTPGVVDIEDANIIERSRMTRADLNDLLDLPGYDTAAVREVLEAYGNGGLNDDWDTTDSERAVYENRENPMTNRSGMIACLEFQGNVQGSMLLEHGMTEEEIPDPVRDYFVQVWVVGSRVIKVQLAPSPRKRHQYYVTSFEKVPGSPVGNGLPDILADIQDVSNATLRALVNNMSIASGPQVVINDDRVADDADSEELFPWKRWHVVADPLGNNSQAPISFFQPNSNAQELMQVYTNFVNMADELSAVPRYLTGGQAGSVGRTASGLSMLMGNASKILQTVAANIDRDIFDPLLNGLYDLVMLTDESGMLTGDEMIRVLGVTVAIQRETQRSRQMEFLTATANPIDSTIIGPAGRATILRSVADTLGLPGSEIVPSEDQIKQQQAAAQQMAMQQGVVGHSQGGDQGAQAQGAGANKQSPSMVTRDTGPRTNMQQQAPKPRIAGG